MTAGQREVSKVVVRCRGGQGYRRPTRVTSLFPHTSGTQPQCYSRESQAEGGKSEWTRVGHLWGCNSSRNYLYKTADRIPSGWGEGQSLGHTHTHTDKHTRMDEHTRMDKHTRKSTETTSQCHVLVELVSREERKSYQKLCNFHFCKTPANHTSKCKVILHLRVRWFKFLGD